MFMSWRSSAVRICGVLLVLLALMLTAAEEAAGATHVMKDTRHDTYAPVGPGSRHFTRKPWRNGDITAVRTSHRVKSVRVVVHTRKLPKYRIVGIDLVTSAKHRPDFTLYALAVGGTKDVMLVRGRDEEIKCRGLRVRFDRADAAIRAHIPRRCLGNPRWVRTGVLLMSSPKKFSPMRTDVAGKNVISDRWLKDADHLPLSPRVRVG